MSKAVSFAHLDNAHLGWVHFKQVMVAGVGFFGDAYDIFSIGLALPMLYQ
jgi:PHS family inorganic phosphate transporter-like MFS transporter